MSLEPRKPFKRTLSAAVKLLPYGILVFVFWMPLVLWMAHFGLISSSTFTATNTFGLLLWNTLSVATVTATLSIVLAYPLALLEWQSQAKLSALMVLPMMVGLLARNYSWIGIFSAALSPGLAHAQLLTSLSYTRTGVFIVMVCIFIPIAFFILRHALNSIRLPLLDAGRSLGASEVEILGKLVLPQTFRQALIGFIFIFASALGYFVTPRMIGGGKHDMTGNLIWDLTNKLGDFEAASYTALLFFLFSIPLYFIGYAYIIAGRRRKIGR